MMKIKSGDKVKVISGDDRGKTGKVMKVLPRRLQVAVEGVNVHKRHAKSRDRDHPGGIIEINLPIDVAKVMLVCPKCRQPARVKHAVVKSAQGVERHRVCGRCREMVD
jgi:large subunit ribosomal protein L24